MSAALVGGAITMFVVAAEIPLDSSKTVASVTFRRVANRVGGSITAMHVSPRPIS